MQRHLLQDAMSFESKKALLFLKNLGENSQQSLNNLTLKSIAIIIVFFLKSTIVFEIYLEFARFHRKP